MSDLPGIATLQRMAGRWRVTMSVLGADGGVTRSEGLSSTRTLIAGGRYLREELSGAFAGSLHEKITILGFNATRARWEYFTADNHDGVLLLYVGAAGAAATADRVEVTAEYAAPSTTGGTVDFTVVRTVLDWAALDRHTLQSYYRPGGQEERPFLTYAYVRDGRA